METAVDPGQVVLDRIAAREVERARLEAATAADLLRTWLAFCAGRIDPYRASLIASAAAPVTTLAGVDNQPGPLPPGHGGPAHDAGRPDSIMMLNMAVTTILTSPLQR